MWSFGGEELADNPPEANTPSATRHDQPNDDTDAVRQDDSLAPPSVRQRKRARGGDTPNIQTIGDASAHVAQLFDAQLERTDGTGSPNVSCAGDDHVRALMQSILPPNDVRALFMRAAQTVDTLPRVRSLFGAPPYLFLQPGDASLLSAQGFAHTRRNMAYEGARFVPTYAQFGMPQLVDEEGREYRVVHRQASVVYDTPLGIALLSAEGDARSGTQGVLLAVRVKKRRRAERIAQLRDPTTRAAAYPPRVGEHIVLQESAGMRGLRGATLPSTRMRVRSTRSADASSSVALVAVTM
jgi:hypothetical protein